MKNLLCAVALALGVWAAPSHAADLVLKEGWNSWSIVARAGTPNWCCFSTKGGGVQSCDLDRKEVNFGSFVHQITQNVKIYALSHAGKIVRLHAFGANCAVTTSQFVQDIDGIEGSTSLQFLQRQAPSANADLADALLPAIAMHTGSEPWLLQAAKADSRTEVRNMSWFWLAQINAKDLEAPAMQALHSLGSTNIDEAEEVVFALSQLPEKRAAAALIEICKTRTLPMAVRKKAVFWLAEVDGDTGLAYLDQLLDSK